MRRSGRSPRRQPTQSPANDTPKRQEGVFRFPPGDPIYRDHFPGCAIVPGSLIVQAFLERADDTAEIRGFGFRSFVTPGEYRYRMEPVAGGWECLLLEGDKILVKGRLIRR